MVWFCFVLPALLLNYFGQGALLLDRPEGTLQPFFHLAPDRALLPLVVLSTAATIIASQAVITGAFPLTRQAVQSGFAPRLRVQQTSELSHGRIYMPGINWALVAWRDRLYAVMVRNTLHATSQFRIPAGRVIEIGLQLGI